MPTYEYECTACGHKFEAFQQITEKPLSKCPKCAKKVKRLFSAGGGIIFKGSGFYATDYKKSGAASKGDAPACPKSKDGTCGGCNAH
jgi:putative FmdB family regulatory protein